MQRDVARILVALRGGREAELEVLLSTRNGSLALGGHNKVIGDAGVAILAQALQYNSTVTELQCVFVDRVSNT